MNKFDEKYIDLCRRILKEGEEIKNYAKTDQRKKSDASAIGAAVADRGRADYAGAQTQASLNAGHSRQGYGDQTDSLQGGTRRPGGINGHLCAGSLCPES